jgi:hypothetical protein
MSNIYEEFARLCHHAVYESSEAHTFLRTQGAPSTYNADSATKVIKFLHAKKGLAHDQGFEHVDPREISWSAVKEHNKWLLMKFPTGTGAIMATRSNYLLVAARNEPSDEVPSAGTFLEAGVMTVVTNTTKDANAWFKKNLGSKPIAYYISSGRNYRNVSSNPQVVARDKRKNRSQPPADLWTEEKLLAKFSPLFLKAVTAAKADIKGMVSMMIKNDSIDKAGKKLRTLNELTVIEQRLAFGELPKGLLQDDLLRKSLKNAVVLTAYKFFPEDTGEPTHGYRGYEHREEGVKKFLSELSKGNYEMMGTLLGAFKHALIIGT